jgi:hypothetical protein
MSAPSIHVDASGVRRQLGNGTVEQIAWDDLLEVAVVTTSDGPFAEDVFFVLEGTNGTSCVVPQSVPESARLLEVLQRLPGFDNDTFIRAMTSTGDERFICWRR